MVPDALMVGIWEISIWLEVFSELSICKPCCLFKAVHVSFDFNIDISFVFQCVDIVFFDDIVWNEFDRYFHVFGSFHE